MSGEAYDPRVDSLRCWQLAIRLKHERGLIEGRYLPSSPAEMYVVEAGRRFVGIELKEAYWRQACRHLEHAEASRASLFDSIEGDAPMFAQVAAE